MFLERKEEELRKREKKVKENKAKCLNYWKIVDDEKERVNFHGLIIEIIGLLIGPNKLESSGPNFFWARASGRSVRVAFVVFKVGSLKNFGLQGGEDSK